MKMCVNTKNLSKFLLGKVKTLVAFCCIGFAFLTTKAGETQVEVLKGNWKGSDLKEKFEILADALTRMEVLESQPERGVFRLVIAESGVPYLSNSTGKSWGSWFVSWVNAIPGLQMESAQIHNNQTHDAIFGMFPDHIKELLKKGGEDFTLERLEMIKSLAIKYYPEEAKEVWGEELEKTEATKRSEVVVSTEWPTESRDYSETIEKRTGILLDCHDRLKDLSRTGLGSYCCLIKGSFVIIVAENTVVPGETEKTYEAMGELAEEFEVSYSPEDDSANVTQGVLAAYLELLRQPFFNSFSKQTIQLPITEEWRRQESQQRTTILSGVGVTLKENPGFRLVFDEEKNRFYLSNITRSTFKMESVANWLCGDGSDYQEKNKKTWIEVCGVNVKERTLSWLREMFCMPESEAGLLWGIDITGDNIDKIRLNKLY